MDTQASDQPKRFPCIICEKEDDVTDPNLQRVRKGIRTIISHTEELEERELLQRLQKVEPGIEELHIYAHNSCRVELKNNANKAKKRAHSEDNPGSAVKRRSLQRSSDQQFQWQLHCFICGDECTDEYRSESWCLCEKVLREKPEYTRDKFLALLEGRSDENSESIKRRLASCSDLPAVDARYHVKCKSNLNVLSIASPTVFKLSGRPKNKRQAENFDRLCSWLEK